MTDLSVIIPCYNSAGLVASRVAELEAVLGATTWSWEILLCDDGSADATPELCRRLAEESPRRRYLPSAVNRGRGRNVSDGIRQSRGRFVGFMDADRSTAAHYLVPAVLALLAGADVAQAHRNYKIHLAEFPFIVHRFLAHVTYAALVRLALGIRGHDTETGFKFFRREAALRLLERTEAAGWFWDTEVIANAHVLGCRVAEVPSLFIRTKGMGSTVRLARDSWTQFWALLRYARRLKGRRLRGPCCA